MTIGGTGDKFRPANTSVLWPLNREHGLLRAMDRFDLETAYILAQASRAAYPDSVQTAQTQLGLDQIIPFEEGVVAGFAGCFGANIVVAFRGTPFLNKGGEPLQLAEAIFTDLDAGLTQYAGMPGSIHRGFANTLPVVSGMLSTILQGLQNLQNPKDRQPRRRNTHQRLWFTGHSMGGALAVLAAKEMYVQHHILPQVYTYGAPRVGNRTFGEHYEPTHYRIERRKDLVPYAFPPYTLIPGTYKHTGIRCCIDGDQIEIGGTFDPLGMIDAQLGREHNIDTYLEDLKKKLRIAYLDTPAM